MSSKLRLKNYRMKYYKAVFNDTGNYFGFSVKQWKPRVQSELCKELVCIEQGLEGSSVNVPTGACKGKRWTGFCVFIFYVLLNNEHVLVW
jgi:hypothetical protein